jgi:hypothetical protein
MSNQTENIQIQLLDIPRDVKDFILSQDNTFHHQFLFYYCDVGHDLDKSIARAFSECIEIYLNLIHNMKDVINDGNRTDMNKVDRIKNWLDDF